jgi:hypothetical protein
VVCADPGIRDGVAPWATAHCLVVATVAGRARWVVVKVDPVARESGVLKGPLAGASASGAGSDGLTQIVVTPAGLWAAPSGSGGVVRVTRGRRRVSGRVYYANRQRSGLAAGDRIVFAGLGGSVLQLDPATGNQLGPPLRPPGEITAVAYGGGNAWIATRDGGVYRYPPGDHALALAGKLPWEATSLAAGGGYLWAAGFSAGQIARIGPIPTA